MASGSAGTSGSRSSTRLYIGNLSASVDEYLLIKLCAKYGKVVKLDFLFHKTGPLRGKPRGYAFVEYATMEEALKATEDMNDKLVRGRKLTVTPASESQYTHSDDQRFKSKGAVRSSGPAQTTALSLLKSAHQPRGGGSTTSKIAMLEAKLAAMDDTKSRTASPALDSDAEGQGSRPRDEGDSTFKIDHKAAGLPARPLFNA